MYAFQRRRVKESVHRECCIRQLVDDDTEKWQTYGSLSNYLKGVAVPAKKDKAILSMQCQSKGKDLIKKGASEPLF